MKLNPYPGTFLVKEGSEGGGKSTQAKLLAERLEREGHRVLLTQQPTKDGIFGKFVRFIYMTPPEERRQRISQELSLCISSAEFQALARQATPKQKKYLGRFEAIAQEIFSGNLESLGELLQIGMTFDGLDHQERVVVPHLARGIHVVSDRWRLSTPAYAAGDGLDWRPFLEMQFDILGDDFIAPNMVFCLNVPVDVGLARTSLKLQGRKEHFDDPDKMSRIQAAYAEILEDPRLKNTLRVAVIDGTPGKEEVHRKIWEQVQPMLAGSS